MIFLQLFVRFCRVHPACSCHISAEEKFSLETVGIFDTRDEVGTVALYLDTLARTLYQENKRLAKK